MFAFAQASRGKWSRPGAENFRRPVAFRHRCGMLARLAWFCFAAAGAIAVAPRTAAQASREYDLKAALIFHFTQFVEWPASAFATPDAPLVIGILGEDPFGGILDEIVHNERCGQRPIKIERYRNLPSVRNCQILFVGNSERENLARINAALRFRPILTVAEFEGFATRGGMIRMVRNTENKIALRINLNAIKAAGLTVSAKLLRVAEVVNPTD